ncbi:SMI1/KNR4 family protein [Streptomyces zhihengii]|uniref:SMI1/KNR4 family protein n=1 Tax=Streptomyces zhihengii TaxID=1818004 RepID=UPI0036782F92
MTDTPPSVRAAWARIDAWLAAHAPRSFALLAPPADPADVERAQQETGLRFPQELLDSLACHDGSHGSPVLPGRPLLPAEGIIAVRRRAMDLLEWAEQQGWAEDDDEGEPTWHPMWVPFAEGDGDAEVIDLRTWETYGLVGTVHHDEGGLQDTWPSLGAYLTATADALDQGGTVGVTAPYLTPDRALEWHVPAHVRPERALTPAPAGGRTP